MKNYIFAYKSISSCVWNKGRGTQNTSMNSGNSGINIMCSTTDSKPSVFNTDKTYHQNSPIKSLIFALGLIIALTLSLQGIASASKSIINNTNELSKTPFDINEIVEKAEHLPSFKDGKFIVKDSAYEVIFDSSRITYIPVISGMPSSDLFTFQVSTIGTSAGDIFWNNNKVTKPIQKENAIVYQRTSNIQEVYDNLNKGVEQSWILNKNEGFSESSDLRITMKINTALNGKISPQSGIDFTDNEGVAQVKYSKAIIIDANNNKLEVEPEWNKKTSEIVLSISGEWLAKAAYPVVVDPLIGANIQVDNLTTTDNYPAIAFGTSNYLIAWQTGTPLATGLGSTAIRGVRVSSTGTILDATPLLIGDTAGKDDEFPSVTYDSVNSRFIVVWMLWNSATSADVNGMTVGEATGTVSTAFTAIAGGTSIFAYPAVACCDVNNNYYVVYGSSGADTTNFTQFMGQTYNRNTHAAATGSNPMATVSSSTITPDTEPRSAPRLYTLTTTKYMLTWETFDADTNGDISANLLTVATTPSYTWGTQVSVAATGATLERYPRAAYDGTNALIVYQLGATTNADVYGRFVTPGATSLTLGTAYAVSNVVGSMQTYPDVAYTAGTCSATPINRYMVVWQDYRNNATNPDIYGSAMTTAGAVETAVALATNTTYIKQLPSITADSGSCGYMASWSDYRNNATTSSDIYAQRVGYPNLSNLSPTSGAVGASISINGINFGSDPGAGNRSTATNNVKINGVQVPDADVTLWSDVVVTFTIPTGTASGTYPVTVTAGSWTSNSNNLTVSAFGPATKVAFTTQPVGGSGGTVWATQPVATIQDAGGNTVTTATDNVTLSISSNPSGGILTCTSTTVAAVNGVATFAGCKIDKAGSPYTLQAAAAGLTSAISNTFNITVGTPAQLIFSTQPVYGITGTAWVTQPVVTVQDAGGNTVTTATNSITLAIGTNPGGGVLVCTTNPLSAISGAASFSGCQINMAGNGYTLTASATGLSGATSVSFNIIQALQITTVSLPNGYEWLSYSSTVAVAGGVSPYTWSISAGSLPTGLTLNSGNGLISGTPTAFGTYNFTVQVTDMTNPTIQTATQAFTVTIYQLTTITVTPANPVITPGQTVQFTATGTYSDNNTSDISTIVTWGSTNPSIATVNSTGLASGVMLGNVTITATK